MKNDHVQLRQNLVMGFDSHRHFLSLTVGALAGLIFANPVFADQESECGLVRAHSQTGQEAYGDVFDEAEAFLRENKIEYSLYGRKHYYPKYYSYGTQYKEKYCSDVYGGCAADKFEIDVTLFNDRKAYPNVLITPKPGAKAAEHGYVILGKLSGLVHHKSCQDREYIDGHTWKATISMGEVMGNIDQRGYVETSLSQVGATVARGYYTGLLPSYEGRTLVIKMDVFGNGPDYTRFNNIIDTLPGAGIVHMY